jgi:hypothetical protein
MKVSNSTLPGYPDMPVKRVDHLPIEGSIDDGYCQREWYFLDKSNPDTGSAAVYAFVRTESHRADFHGYEEIVLDERDGVDPDDPVFAQSLFKRVRWARDAAAAKLANRDEWDDEAA